jgi:phosphoribosylaminoimidazolecarboxamide formyltransferase/IMP cyclohydrolase
MKDQTQTNAALNALLMFYDKTGTPEFGQRLINLGYQLYGSTGTAKALNAAGVPCIDIATIVGDPLINHKVVSLSREIHAGLLAETMEEINEITEKGIMKFSLACIDFYPLENAAADEFATPESIRKQTDIGGPTVASSAAKGGVPVVIEVSQREDLLTWLEAGKPEESAYLQKLEAHVNYVVSRYRGISAKFLDTENQYLVVHGEKTMSLKYGENPQQKFAALYVTDENDPLALNKFKVAYGGNPSYVTMTDVDRVVETVIRTSQGFWENTQNVPKICVAVKHGNACGAAYSEKKDQVIKKSISGDSEAVLGAVVACNFSIDTEELDLLFRSHDPSGKKWGMLSAIVCSEITEAALQILKDRNSGCLVFANPEFHYASARMHEYSSKKVMRSVRGGFLVQDAAVFVPSFAYDKEFIVHNGNFPVEQRGDLILAWALCGNSNSNTITIVQNCRLLGNAVGQQKRVASAKLAIEKALFATGNDDAPLNDGAVAWGDSFFPYPDGVEVLHEAGISVIVATRGSKRDQDVIDFCVKKGINFMTYPDNVGRLFSNH